MVCVKYAFSFGSVPIELIYPDRYASANQNTLKKAFNTRIAAKPAPEAYKEALRLRAHFKDVENRENPTAPASALMLTNG